MLVSLIGLAWPDFSRPDPSDVRWAHIATNRTFLALVETGDGTGPNLVHSHRYAQMRARRRIRGSSSSPVACTSQRSDDFAAEKTNIVYRSSDSMRSFCRER